MNLYHGSFFLKKKVGGLRRSIARDAISDEDLLKLLIDVKFIVGGLKMAAPRPEIAS